MANQQSPAQQFIAMNGIYDTSKYIDETNFYNQRNGDMAMLTSKMTYMIGKQKGNLALSQRFLGAPYFDMNGMAKLEGENPFNIATGIKTIEASQFNYPFMVNARKGGEVGKNNFGAGDRLGRGKTSFFVIFKTNNLHKYFVVRSPKGTQCYVVAEPTPVGNEYRYEFKMVNGSDTTWVDYQEFNEGVIWINLFSAVAQSGSRTTDIGRAITPAFAKNQTTKSRVSLTWAGPAADLMTKVLAFVDKDVEGNYMTDGKGNAKMYWMDQYTYNFEVDCAEYMESLFWYAEYNRQANGEVALKDTLTGKVIATGAAILQQIINKMTYSVFSYDYLSDLIGRAYYGIGETPQTKTLYTGTLGFRKFDAAMKAKGINFLTEWGFIADKFVTGTDRNLMLGGYFDGFYHVDGWIIKVKKVDIFDNGLISNSPIDEESGLPYESARMVLIDDAMYEGENNIQLVRRKGFEPFQHGLKRGMNNVPTSMSLMASKNTLDNGLIPDVTTDTDASTYMRIYEAGVQMMRGNTSLDLQYNPTNW